MVRDFKTINNYLVSLGNSCWLSTLKSKKIKPFIELTKLYYKNYYPEYDNFKAINVDKVKDIPIDYKSYMGVPITFLMKWNSDQFRIVGNIGENTVMSKEFDDLKKDCEVFVIKKNVKRRNAPFLNGAQKFRRICIIRK